MFMFAAHRVRGDPDRARHQAVHQRGVGREAALHQPTNSRSRTIPD